MTADAYTWLYAVLPAGAAPDPATLRGLSGVAGEHPRLVTAQHLAAAAGPVPRAEFEAPALERRLRDPGWLEQAVRAHHRVIDALTSSAPTLPLRFATLYRDEERVLSLLADHRTGFEAALRRIADRTEWGVKAYLDAVGQPDQEVVAPGTAAAHDRPGTAYLLRRRAARDRSAHLLDEAVERGRQVHGALTEVAAEATEHPAQSPEASGVRDPMVLNGAYLVDRSRTDELARRMAELREAHAPVLRLELSGPWPPYSFADFPTAPDGE
ncbi:gas vesicle protein GvpFL [Streptomyces tateyamensis]|uniref:Gas vesicle protein GvpFL n=1 Tax=Streptomyces tateyamensis TaxID=565073 RepID=A0A2V4P9K9_9ACTN|nr:GvpL/GvpF family gas vesicle protein [Streptomyces tateyamensis]PYC87602.1 gas vesicle protein GvpFL [Streptomyces tateyamensis]